MPITRYDTFANGMPSKHGMWVRYEDVESIITLLLETLQESRRSRHSNLCPAPLSGPCECGKDAWDGVVDKVVDRCAPDEFTVARILGRRR